MHSEPDIIIEGIGALHRVDSSDRDLVLAWRNAPDVRAAMYTRHVISHAEHVSWWTRFVSDPARSMFMAAGSGAELGVVGVEAPAGTQSASWWFYAAPGAPRGAGRRMEALALELVFGPMARETLACEVREENVRVIALHESFGFEKTGEIMRDTPEGPVKAVQLALTSKAWSARRAGMLDEIAQTGDVS